MTQVHGNMCFNRITNLKLSFIVKATQLFD